jgi:hypothetical protein
VDEFAHVIFYNGNSGTLRKRECVISMMFKDLTLRDDMNLASPLRQAESEQTMVQALVVNQSPIMKVWFVMMVVNLALFLFLIR